MAELLKIVRRGPRCDAYRNVGGGDGCGYLKCDLTDSHPGPLHYDESDEIWWFSDAR